MSIAIKKEKCAGCRKCTSVCPGSLIKTDEDGKAYIKYPRDCWGCASCLKECKFGAIEFYLGADIGGIGSKPLQLIRKTPINIRRKEGSL